MNLLDFPTTLMDLSLMQPLKNFFSRKPKNNFHCENGIKKKDKEPSTEVLKLSQFYSQTEQSAGLAKEKRKLHKFRNKSENVLDELLNREKGMMSRHQFTNAKKNLISNRYLPNQFYQIDEYDEKAFCGIFSKDGQHFITACQDEQIRLYQSGSDSYKLNKILKAEGVGWSIIDLAFSPNTKNFVYSTWSPILNYCSIEKGNTDQESLYIADSNRRFCIFSISFSSNGKEILSGANDGCLYIYNLERKCTTSKVPAHYFDVNCVAFADSSSNILYSGGDDGIVKVWDRRTLNDLLPKPVGSLAGHLDGVTYIDSRQDGRHLISNSKDQSIKLWDIRVFSTDNAVKRSLKAALDQSWDYRWQEVPKKLCNNKMKVKGDTSIMTYRGHVVSKTLIRCRFSPLETTGQRYIYTGGNRLIVYDSLSGKMVRVLNNSETIVRDVSWHPLRNEILTTSWDGSICMCVYEDSDCPFSLKL